MKISRKRPCCSRRSRVVGCGSVGGFEKEHIWTACLVNRVKHAYRPCFFFVVVHGRVNKCQTLLIVLLIVLTLAFV